MMSGARRQKQRHWAVEMEVKVDELAKLADAIRTQRATLAARRASLEVSATLHGPLFCWCRLTSFTDHDELRS